MKTNHQNPSAGPCVTAAVLLALGLISPGGSALAAAEAAAGSAVPAESTADGPALSPVSTAAWDRATSNGAMALSDIEPGRSAGDGRLVGTIVHLHILDEALRRSLGGQSGRLVVDMDCRSGWFRSRDMVVWSGPYESGAARPLRTTAEWSAAGGGAYLGQLTRSVCDQAGLTGLPVTEPAPTVVKASALSLLPTGAPSQGLAADAPQAVGHGPAPDGAGAYHIQFVASRSERAVRDMVAREAPRLAAILGDLNLSVQRAAVGGQVFYRGRIGGFASAVAARAFCGRVISQGLPCILTPPPPSDRARLAD